jgi:hypothetical protein
VSTTVASANAALNYTTVTPSTVGYAASVAGSDTIGLYGPYGTSATPRTYYGLGGNSDIAFDPTGVLWFASGGSSTYAGVSLNGSPAGTFTLSGNLLAFDLSGNAYALSSPTAFAPCPIGFVDSSTVNIYSISSGSPTLIRTITAAGPVNSAVAGPSGTVYVGTAGGVYEYGSAGNGAITPLASNTSAVGPVATDSQGNVYAIYNGSPVKWNAGSFGSAPPAVTYTAPGVAANQSPLNLAVDPSGNVFLSYAGYTGGNASTLVVYPNGSTTSTVLLTSASLCTYLATPLH